MYILKDDFGNTRSFVCPISTSVENNFSAEILEELVREGYSGTALVEEFKSRAGKIRPATEALLAQAEQEALTGRAIPLDELFGKDE